MRAVRETSANRPCGAIRPSHGRHHSQPLRAPPLAGREPPLSTAIQVLPELPPARSAARDLVGRWPRLGFLLRDFRGR